jgi:hypothetical protein
VSAIFYYIGRAVPASCHDHVFTRLGRAAIGVNQQQGGGDYPFVQPNDALRNLIADIALSYDDPHLTYTRPLRVAWLYGFGCLRAEIMHGLVNDQDMAIVDADGRTIFDTTAADTFTATPWGERFMVYRWTSVQAVLAVTVYTTWTHKESPRRFPVYYEPAGLTGILDERVGIAKPAQLHALRVNPTGHVIQGSGAIIAGGYNIATTASTGYSGQRPVTTIVLSAVPGSGEGRAPADCRGILTPYIRRINGVASNNGDFQLDATNCYRIDRPLRGFLVEGKSPREGVISPSTLRLSADCGSCCTCDDYVRVYEAIRRLRDRIATLVDRTHTVRDRYIENLTRFLRSKRCREENRLRFAAEEDCVMLGNFAAGYCNNSPDCITNLVLLISFTYSDAEKCGEKAETGEVGDVTIVRNTTIRSGNTPFPGNPPARARERYQLNGTWPHYWAYFEQVQPGAMASVSWRMSFPGAISGTVVEAIVDAYSLDEEPDITDACPVPGYILGAGPGLLSRRYRLVPCPSKISIALDDCSD